ncbi:MAG: hypothetical protein KC983_08035, partial [Phycisphaerales bacterium]|nr:hypothetical protein [Phycisphaerales bacterium]
MCSMSNCRLTRNKDNMFSATGAVVYSTGTTTLTGLVLDENRGGIFAVLMYAPAGEIFMWNCTGIRNYSAGRPNIFILCDNLTARNCIFWGNEAGVVAFGNGSVEYCCAQSEIAGAGNIVACPKLGADFMPGADSPCVDAGSNDEVPASLTLDFLGNPRFDDDGNVADTGVGLTNVVDMGAVERNLDTPLSPTSITVAPGSSIQTAIVNTLPGSIITLEPGVYNETFDFFGQDHVVRSTDPADPAVVASTVLDGTGLNDAIVRCVLGESAATVLDGLHIRGYHGTLIGSTPVQSDHIRSAVYISKSTPTIRRCLFTNNGYDTAPSVYSLGSCIGFASGNTDVTVIEDCSFYNNMSYEGGSCVTAYRGIELDIRRCVFNSNESQGFVFGGNSLLSGSPSGGAVSVKIIGSCPELVRIVDCHFEGNIDRTAFGGGGVSVVGAPLEIHGCTFIGNTSSGFGGGVNADSPYFARVEGCSFWGNIGYIGGGAFLSAPQVRVQNCTLNGNHATESGGGMSCNAFDPESNFLANCTFTRNTAGMFAAALYASGDFTVVNSIIWNNPGGPQLPDPASGPQVSYSIVEGGYPGVGNIDANPMLVNVLENNLHVLAGSPAIDAGDTTRIGTDFFDADQDNNTTEPIPADLDDHLRVFDDQATIDTGVPAAGNRAVVDMGAFEFGSPELIICAADCAPSNGDGS